MANPTNASASAKTTLRIERIFPATADRIWELWTTARGIESWWAPDGFRCEVQKVDVRPGGELIYTFTAIAPEQIEFMKNAGMPLTTQSRKTFTEVVPTSRLAYRSVVDFVPGVAPYDQLTIVELRPSGSGTKVTMLAEPLHDEEWTRRLVMGRENELDNLGKLLAAR